ncbi:MAG: DUF1648 domain-containing protein [Syntrophomonadaceae bacterium]|nr:DUF1648 domain-containing protein [Syntrophomonadaceae bacterium]
MQLKNYHWFMIIVCLVCFGLTLYYPLTYYDMLPYPIPTHFNFKGEPDGWSPKSMANVLIIPIILGLTLLFMLPLTLWMAKVDDPRKLINLPKKQLEKITTETAEEVRYTTVLHLLIILLLTSLLLLAITLNQIMVALGQTANLGSSVLALVILLLVDTLYFTWKVITLTYGK